MVGAGQSVGLFGGTFDPPHAGHLLAATRALKRCELDWVWWMPSPGNPLKSRQPAPMEQRLRQIRELAQHPRMIAADIEMRLGTRYTIDTLGALQALYPNVRFVLIFGADILGEFHRWRNWRTLANMAPICTLARPKDQLSAGLSPFAKTFSRYRLEPEAAPMLKFCEAPAWTILPGPMNSLSSTQLRQAKANQTHIP